MILLRRNVVFGKRLEYAYSLFRIQDKWANLECIQKILPYFKDNLIVDFLLSK